jgi:predicted ATP-grasp superfamily ATP-dependent carboligase
MPEHCGTLAAARCLGDAGVDVWTAGEAPLATAGHSRSVTRRLRCPPVDQTEHLIEWLVAVGSTSRDTVLYPTSDDFAWLQALHESELSPRYRLYAPPAGVIETLLDKRALGEACARVGMATPRAYFPDTDAELERVAREAPMPLLIKQRTQVLSRTRSKGRIVHNRADLAREFAEFASENTYGPAIHERLPQATRPFLQEYHHEGVSGSYLVSGFIDRSGDLFVARAANKVMQRPRALGIALCAEAAPLDRELVDRIRALCRSVGYFGVFQMEFLRVDGVSMLIDVNPRYYHYMAFDIARGMPLPLLAHLAASGDDAALAREVEHAQVDLTNGGSGARAFTYGLHFGELLLTHTLTGAISWREAAQWRRWRASHRGHIVDAVHDPHDGMPSLVDAALHLAHNGRHPRSFLRFALGR